MSDARAAPDRVASLDIVRGAVMVLMAIDHVRVYSGLPPGGPTPGLFFTRWITHFCAPAFVFLAGTSAYLHGQKLADRVALARFLVTRGLWLILLELTVIRVAWTFNFDFAHYLLAGVIWVLGWSMIALAGLIWLPLAWIGAIGGIIVAGHNLLDPLVGGLWEGLESNPFAWFWSLLYLGGEVRLGATGPPLIVLYVLVPWVGVMALGYAFGAVMRLAPADRRRWCLGLGLGAVAIFVVLRGLNLYGDPRPWSGESMPAVLSFLNTTKYPASLLFLLMTLGPMIAVLPLLEQAQGWLARALTVFGRVPMFYYLLHIPLIHLAAMVVSIARQGAVVPWLYANHPMRVPDPPEGYVWGLGLLYLVTFVVVGILYPICRWYGGVKRRSGAGWLSYL